MRYAFEPEKLLPALLKFKEDLFKLGAERYSCMLRKINIYLKEYLNEEQLKELEMAFVSIGQKYGFVSAGDEFRKKLAEANQKAEAEKLETARKMVADKTISLEKAMEYFSLTKDQILAK